MEGPLRSQLYLLLEALSKFGIKVAWYDYQLTTKAGDGQGAKGNVISFSVLSWTIWLGIAGELTPGKLAMANTLIRKAGFKPGYSTLLIPRQS